MTRKTKRSMKLRLALGALALSAIFAGLAQNFPQGAQAQPIPSGAPRLALVIGEAAYKVGPLSSAANDAGLIAQTLQQAGFDVTGAADLDQDGLRKTLREFLDKRADINQKELKEIADKRTAKLMRAASTAAAAAAAAKK